MITNEINDHGKLKVLKYIFLIFPNNFTEISKTLFGFYNYFYWVILRVLTCMTSLLFIHFRSLLYKYCIIISTCFNCVEYHCKHYAKNSRHEQFRNVLPRRYLSLQVGKKMYYLLLTNNGEVCWIETRLVWVKTVLKTQTQSCVILSIMRGDMNKHADNFPWNFIRFDVGVFFL